VTEYINNRIHINIDAEASFRNDEGGQCSYYPCEGASVNQFSILTEMQQRDKEESHDNVFVVDFEFG
jgi:hypothetical protein